MTKSRTLSTFLSTPGVLNSKGLAGFALTNPSTITTPTTFDPNTNSISVGPITLPSGIDVVLPSTSNWRII